MGGRRTESDSVVTDFTLSRACHLRPTDSYLCWYRLNLFSYTDTLSNTYTYLKGKLQMNHDHKWKTSRVRHVEGGHTSNEGRGHRTPSSSMPELLALFIKGGGGSVRAVLETGQALVETLLGPLRRVAKG